MTKNGIYWVIPPEAQLIPNLHEYGRRAEIGLYILAQKWGQEVQDKARVNAKWEDRTGHARSGLFYAVEGLGFGEVRGEIRAETRGLMTEAEVVTAPDGVLMIAISHTMFYGKYLELSNGGRFAIIMTTIEQNLPSLEQQVRKIFS